MIQLGTFNTLRLVARSGDYLLLDGGHEYGDIPLPEDEAAPGLQSGDSVNAFVYMDEDGYLAATTQTPRLQLGELARLKVLAVESDGAWLDWGLDSALFLPRDAQQGQVEAGRYCLVALHIDPRRGLLATAKLNSLIKDEATGLQAGDKVQLLVARRTDLGYKMVVNNLFWGLLHASDAPAQELHRGQVFEGYIKRVRADQRLDLTLNQPGYARIPDMAGKVLQRLQEAGGRLPYGDHSAPEDIQAEFGISKKAFKQAIGALFRNKQLLITEEGICLPDARPPARRPRK